MVPRHPSLADAGPVDRNCYLGAVADPKLPDDIADVHLDGAIHHTEAGGYLLVGASATIHRELTIASLQRGGHAVGIGAAWHASRSQLKRHDYLLKPVRLPELLSAIDAKLREG